MVCRYLHAQRNLDEVVGNNRTRWDRAADQTRGARGSDGEPRRRFRLTMSVSTTRLAKIASTPRVAAFQYLILILTGLQLSACTPHPRGVFGTTSQRALAPSLDQSRPTCGPVEWHSLIPRSLMFDANIVSSWRGGVALAGEIHGCQLPTGPDQPLWLAGSGSIALIKPTSPTTIHWSEPHRFPPFGGLGGVRLLDDGRVEVVSSGENGTDKLSVVDVSTGEMRSTELPPYVAFQTGGVALINPYPRDGGKSFLSSLHEGELRIQFPFELANRKDLGREQLTGAVKRVDGTYFLLVRTWGHPPVLRHLSAGGKVLAEHAFACGPAFTKYSEASVEASLVAISTGDVFVLWHHNFDGGSRGNLRLAEERAQALNETPRLGCCEPYSDDESEINSPEEALGSRGAGGGGVRSGPWVLTRVTSNGNVAEEMVVARGWNHRQVGATISPNGEVFLLWTTPKALKVRTGQREDEVVTATAWLTHIDAASRVNTVTLGDIEEFYGWSPEAHIYGEGEKVWVAFLIKQNALTSSCVIPDVRIERGEQLWPYFLDLRVARIPWSVRSRGRQGNAWSCLVDWHALWDPLEAGDVSRRRAAQDACARSRGDRVAPRRWNNRWRVHGGLLNVHERARVCSRPGIALGEDCNW